MKTHFVLPRPVFESPLKQAGSAHSAQGSTVGNHETYDAVFYSGVELANRRGEAGATNEQGVSTPENNGEPDHYNSPTLVW
jgi:hypothetical protein